MEGDRRGELPPYPNQSVILQLSSAELPPAPSQQLGRQKGLALPSMGQTGRDEVMGTCGTLMETQALELGQCGRGTELVEDLVVHLLFCLWMNKKVTLKSPWATLQQHCSPRFGGKGHLPISQLNSSPLGSHPPGMLRKNNLPLQGLGLPFSSISVPPQRLTWKVTGLLQQVGFDGGPCDILLDKSNL